MEQANNTAQGQEQNVQQNTLPQGNQMNANTQQQNVQTTQNSTEGGNTNTTPSEPAEKMISKKLFDEKVSELSQKIKALEGEKRAKMTDDERAAAEKEEMVNELKNVQSELASLKTESSLIGAGIKPEISKGLASAIVSGDVSAIVEAIKATVADVEKETAAKTKREILENGAPKVPLGGSTGEQPDHNMDLVKNAVKKPETKPLTESKWFK